MYSDSLQGVKCGKKLTMGPLVLILGTTLNTDKLPILMTLKRQENKVLVQTHTELGWIVVVYDLDGLREDGKGDYN